MILDYSSQGITDIIKLEIDQSVEELYLYKNKLTKIEGLINLINLKVLRFGHERDEGDQTKKENIESNEITKIEGLENLVKLEVLNINSNKLSKIEGLDTLCELKDLDLGYNYHIKKIENLDNLKKLKTLYLNSNSIKKIEGLENQTNLEELNLNHNLIKDIRGLANLKKLKKLDIVYNEIQDISAFSNLYELKYLDLSNNKVTDIKAICNLEKIEELNLWHNEIKDISDILDYEFIKNGSLKRIILPDSLNWMQIKKGKYITQEVIKELRKKGVEVIMPRSFKYTPASPKKSLSEYLSNDLHLIDQHVNTICSWFHQDRFSPNKPLEQQIRAVNQQSFHEVCRVETITGKKLILKVQSNKLKAEIEQAANNYLSKSGFDFIVPTQEIKPFEYDGLYLTVQENVSDKTNFMQDLSYYLACLAKLHADLRDIDYLKQFKRFAWRRDS